MLHPRRSKHFVEGGQRGVERLGGEVEGVFDGAALVCQIYIDNLSLNLYR